MKRDSAAPPALLGIDGGGTRTIAIYECGDVRRRLETGAGNVGLLSDAQLLALFRELSGVHQGSPAPAAVAIGMAGAGTEDQRARIKKMAARVWRKTPCLAVGDLDTALAAAQIEESAGQNGLSAIVIVLSGTGSIFYGVNARGQRARVGGWGHLVGDKGSAYEIGLRSLKAVLHYHDLDGKVTKLGQRLLSTLLLNELRDVPAWAFSASKTEIAALAREVSAAAREGDKIARDILEGAAHSIARDALTCASRLARRGQRVKFVMTGSVLLNQPAFSRRVAKLIQEGWSSAEVKPLKHEAAQGAVELARELWKSEGGKISRKTGIDHLEQKPREHWTSSLGISSSPTEQRNPRSMKLDQLPLRNAIELILSEDEKLPAAIRAQAPKIERAVQLIVRSFKSGGRLFYVGAGTSGRLGVLDASECPPTFRSAPEMVQGIIAGGQTALWRAVEGAEDDPSAGTRAIQSRGITKRDTVVGIAASGRTPFVWGALDEAKQRGAATVMLALNPNLKVPRPHQPDVLIAPDIGPEILTGSTRLKSGTATKLILNIFTTLAMVKMGKVVSNLMVDLKPTNVKLRDRAVRIVRTLTGCDDQSAREALQRTNWMIKDAVRRLK